MFDNLFFLILMTDLIQQVMRDFRQLSRKTMDELDYEEAVKLLMRHQPKTAFAQAALLRQKAEDGGYTVRAFYLDSENQPVCRFDGSPFGYVIHAQRLDSELDEAFGANNITIVR